MSALRYSSIAALSAFLTAIPASAIVVSGSDPNSSVISYGQTFNGLDLSGVAEVISAGIGGCTGTLLSDGMSILTAGHCVTSSYGSAVSPSITVIFNGPAGLVSMTAVSVAVNPGWTGDPTQGGDLAVLTLNGVAPTFAAQYGLYTGATPSNAEVLAGYGISGTGLTGANGSYGTLRAGENEYLTTGATFNWPSSILIGEFYEAGNPSTNALGVANPYQAADEVNISHGDSGGPSFYNGLIIGVHDLGICLGTVAGCDVPPSVSTDNNSYFGELYGDVSVAAYASWITAQEVQSTPEPASFGLFAAAFGALALARHRRRKATAGATTAVQYNFGRGPDGGLRSA